MPYEVGQIIELHQLQATDDPHKYILGPKTMIVRWVIGPLFCVSDLEPSGEKRLKLRAYPCDELPGNRGRRACQFPEAVVISPAKQDLVECLLCEAIVRIA